MRRLALLGFLVVLVAGCGGDDETAGADEPLTREEFVAELDAICADFQARQQEIGAPQSLDEIVEKGPQIQVEFAGAIQRVHDLGPPPEEIAPEVDRFLEVSEQLRDGLGEVVAAARTNDPQQTQLLLADLGSIDAESDRLATELGAHSCASD